MAYPVTHFEVIGKDNRKLRDFYSKAFDWKLTDAPEDYAMVDTGANGHVEVRSLQRRQSQPREFNFCDREQARHQKRVAEFYFVDVDAGG